MTRLFTWMRGGRFTVTFPFLPNFYHLFAPFSCPRQHCAGEISLPHFPAAARAFAGEIPQANSWGKIAILFSIASEINEQVHVISQSPGSRLFGVDERLGLLYHVVLMVGSLLLGID